MLNKDLFNIDNIRPDFLRELFEKFEKPWEVIKNIRSVKEYCEINWPSRPLCGTRAFERIVDKWYEEIGKTIIIESHVYIGENVTIRPHAYIRSYSIICDNCIVGHSSEIKESIMLPGSSAPHFNYVGNSILGHNVNLGAGCILSNYKISERKEIRIKVEGSYEDSYINTGMEKLGALIGDNSSLACGIITNPGTIIGKNKTIFKE